MVYYVANKNDIDIVRYEKIIDNIGCGIFIDTLFTLINRYFGVSDDCLPKRSLVPVENIVMLLSDLEECGGMNYHDDNRKNSMEIYMKDKMLEEMSYIKYRNYMLKRFITNSIISIFPKRTSLSIKYPYLLKYPILTPYAWLHRLIFRGTKYIRSNKLSTGIINNENHLSDDSKKRVEVFRKLGLIK